MKNGFVAALELFVVFDGCWLYNERRGSNNSAALPAQHPSLALKASPCSIGDLIQPNKAQIALVGAGALIDLAVVLWREKLHPKLHSDATHCGKLNSMVRCPC